MFMQYDLIIEVHRCDAISVKQAVSLKPDYLLISPGPKDPFQTGVSIPLIKRFCDTIPILGVCLGMQCINEAFGGATVRAPLPMHGKTSMITHNGTGLFKGLNSPFKAARYHSLMAKPGLGGLVVSATSPDQVVMGVSHHKLCVHGVQFHPESFLTENGFQIIDNFLKFGLLKRFECHARN